MDTHNSIVKACGGVRRGGREPGGGGQRVGIWGTSVIVSTIKNKNTLPAKMGAQVDKLCLLAQPKEGQQI